MILGNVKKSIKELDQFIIYEVYVLTSIKLQHAISLFSMYEYNSCQASIYKSLALIYSINQPTIKTKIFGLSGS